MTGKINLIQIEMKEMSEGRESVPNDSMSELFVTMKISDEQEDNLETTFKIETFKKVITAVEFVDEIIPQISISMVFVNRPFA